MNKAYDRVEWSFLKECLLKFGFCDQWVVNLILQCVTTVKYSVLFNGQNLPVFSRD